MDFDEPSPKSSRLSPSQHNDHNATHPEMGQQQSGQTLHHSENFPVIVGSSQKLSQSCESTKNNIEKPETRILKYLRERQKSLPKRKEGPLKLLELPLDILKDILKEVTHTNDLANLALVNSALHGIVTPLIYSRFDIVWPDTNGTAEPRLGVDALTYGLATLVMREDLFEHAAPRSHEPSDSCQSYTCMHCGSTNYANQNFIPRPKTLKTRRGNYYSQFTKKFSLGNGPAEWVEEYLVTKECGKMLGTLVALSIARMPNLDTFIWDMPTGVLRDIWVALASLGDHQACKLAKLWVRMHDNHSALQAAGLAAPTAPQQPPQGSSGPNVAPPQTTLHNDAEVFGVSNVVWSNHHIEKPSFSILSPLRSLTVLNIDEAQYLVELSELLYRSIHTLRELRLGMASTLHMSGYVRETREANYLLMGGVFGLLMSKSCQQMAALKASKKEPLDRHEPQFGGNVAAARASTSSVSDPTINLSISGDDLNSTSNVSNQEEQKQPHPRPDLQAFVLDDNAIDPALFSDYVNSDQEEHLAKEPEQDSVPFEPASPVNFSLDSMTQEENLMVAKKLKEERIKYGPEEIPNLTTKLKLDVLEIERFSLQAWVLLRGIDFTMLTSLTLLQCGDTTKLWDELKRQFSPRKSLVLSTPARSPECPRGPPRLRRKPSSVSLSGPITYQLNLKRIHTDSVPKELISFLKTTLAPNSLEWMFLQDDASKSPSGVTLDSIYRGPLKRHRDSLTKVMVDSAYGPASSRARSVAARKWMFGREVLAFVTSGKMSRIRELAMSIEYRDWHFFLQKLPQIPHLRSIYVPYIADHPSGNSFSCREAAMGAVDVVAIRPEVQLCYLAIRNKCFEILEKNQKPKLNTHGAATNNADSDDDSDEHDSNDEDNDSDGSGDHSTASAPVPAPAPHDDDSEADHTPDTDDEDDGRSSPSGGRKVKYKLREILFYDDKISIFKARHGRL